MEELLMALAALLGVFVGLGLGFLFVALIAFIVRRMFP